jgi:hypothetical protein
MFAVLIGVAWGLVIAGLLWLLRSNLDRLGLGDAIAPGDPSCYRDFLGFIYNNPSDRRLIVPRRAGLGWTFNLAHPHARTVVLAILAAPVVLMALAAFRL